MSEKLDKVSISELEKLIDTSVDGEVRIEPNGDVVRLSPTELLEQNLSDERSCNSMLRRELDRMRALLKQIQEIAETRL
jgi:hypothetical protein